MLELAERYQHDQRCQDVRQDMAQQGTAAERDTRAGQTVLLNQVKNLCVGALCMTMEAG